MGATGGQPPFDHRKIPETPDDIESESSYVGCLAAIGLFTLVTLALFILGVEVWP